MSTKEKHGGAQGSNLRDLARVIALSDGVFAIVLTILVLDLRVPELEPGPSLGSALVGLGPTFVAYVIWLSSTSDTGSPRKRLERSMLANVHWRPSDMSGGKTWTIEH